MRSLACLAAVLLLTLVPARASALTVRDVIELTRAGLGDEIILALIDVDPSVFPIDSATLKRLKEAGVSERVILAMVRSARLPAITPDPVAVEQPVPTPEPQVVVIEHHDSPQVREVAVPVAVPVYIPVRTRGHHDSGHDRADHNADPANDRTHREREKRTEPVYWGTGGKLRPDAWQPSSSDRSTKKRPD
jgi:hypothetical protein